ncbi:hypothetical protein BU23DRAFT_155701 [Bimuria novae-zelandiae CBS 107.79]|uniref:Heterokaryon incompatibility domain-containing protein n=1 Tax=Bimuria novae-zelandiae CBS 107.79 TaxID=1447943 RepID=A0A6A5V5D5_9PLEO|nr:hypothetical protein BU23DRAFT_155701 [Bimuria novae-zelandiae CBS 107.79]
MGSFEISGSQLLQLLQKHPADDRSDAPLKLLTDRDEPKSLPELMERYRTWKCSWQRDTVFALLALARRESKEGLLRIPVDYDLPWDVLHHELIRADANRMHKIFRFSEFLHRRFRSFKKPWDPKDSNLDEEQKKETCDLTGFYVGCVQNTVSMFCNTNKELDEYVRKGLNGMDIDHVGIKRELQSFHQDVQGIQLKTFTGARADTFIFTRDPEFKDTLHRCWNIRNLPQVDETSRHSSQEAEGNRTARGLQPQEVPRSPQHSSPVTLNVNIRHVGPQSQNLERITRNAVASPNQPLETRQWFRIEHSKPQNNALCACTGATYGQSLRKGDLVFQFEDSEFAVLARPRSNEAEDDDWTPYRIIGRAVIARDCCHRPEASKREVDNTSFSFRAIDPDNTKMFPIALFRMTISSLVELTRLIESVKGN